MKRSIKVLAAAMATTAVVLLATNASGLAGSFGSNATTPVPGLSTLGTGAIVAPDRIPALSPAAAYVSDVAAARAVGTFAGLDWYFAPGKDGGFCLISVGTTTGGGCSDSSAPYRGGMVTMSALPHNRQLTAIVVPDGYTSASVSDGVADAMSPVASNVLFVVHRKSVSVQITGKDRPTLRHELRNRAAAG